ncbi:MAG TPA: YifB family Mg chelatase-like AAA ATPase [Thermoanaerobaculia bacterium]|nr:YifB family Mg chelatase-like AAA ATPase [Thermoanaerobaculia bacterium]HUM29075.1 YifB family Mg chelatase-like AAA ATPase [Thermoanaerobaculia bacterium]HXK67369.1 YifB family Mg chelatase-like AAA ATPase [Thermoanaerobaculia bacterium]
MLSRVRSAVLVGIDAFPLQIEVDIHNGLPAFTVVGLPDTAIKESRERIRSALRNSGFTFPDGVITANLAPADLKKEGTQLDLALAVAILNASGQVPHVPDHALLAGELSLSGEVRAIHGTLSISLMASREGVKELFVPGDNAPEAAVCDDVAVRPVRHLKDLTGHMGGVDRIPAQPSEALSPSERTMYSVDLSDVRGQWQAKRALEIAAAGGHNLLMVGPPGTGKSILAQRLPTLFPPMELEESLETTRIHSAAGLLPPDTSLLWARPFRSPHHTVSYAGLTGGGTVPRPGEITLAHNGVLFLDELTEFRRDTLEALRQPMENGSVTITRSNRSLTFPARFMLVAAMNPCPCGHLGHPKQPCKCTPTQVTRYRSKISGPLLDRIDLAVDVPALTYDEFTADSHSPRSDEVRKRVSDARKRQFQRLKIPGRTNACMGPREIETFCPKEPEIDRILKSAMDRFGLSGRSIHRTLKVARTIADLEDKDILEPSHVAEALQFRIQVTEAAKY